MICISIFVCLHFQHFYFLSFKKYVKLKYSLSKYHIEKRAFKPHKFKISLLVCILEVKYILIDTIFPEAKKLLSGRVIKNHLRCGKFL